MGNKSPLSFQGLRVNRIRSLGGGYREFMNNTLEKGVSSRDEDKSPDHTQAM